MPIPTTLAAPAAGAAEQARRDLAARARTAFARVAELARRAGVEPSSIRYPEERLEDVGLTRRSIVFSVDGDYPGLRQFINFLELSELFLTLEEVSLAGGTRGKSSKLRISLTVSTLFLEAPPEEAAFEAAPEPTPTPPRPTPRRRAPVPERGRG